MKRIVDFLKHFSFNRSQALTLKLGFPIILSSMGQSMVQMIDTIMIGHLGTKELAAVAFCGTLTYNFLVIGMGIALALTPLTGHALGQGKYKLISSLFQNALSLNFIISIIILGILLLMMPFLEFFGQPSEIINICKPYYFLISLSFVPLLIFLSFKQFLEGLGNTKVAMIITIISNILNIILNYLLIFGKGGFPMMGIEGAAIATLISRLLMPISFAIYIYHKEIYRRYLYFFSFSNFSKFIHVTLLRTGIPIAVQMFLEFFSLMALALMMGWVGVNSLAAYQIVITIISTTFLVASGFANATTILISQAFGGRNFKDINLYFKSGFRLSLISMSIFGLCFVFFGRYIAMVFSKDILVIETATTFFFIAGVFQIIDGTQVSLLGALRGINDVIKPMKYAFISYILVAIPFAYICGFVLNLGTWSIFAGFLTGLLTAACLYYWRFGLVIRKLEKSVCK